jgi:transcriptional regulator with XRE-family HTH domain
VACLDTELVKKNEINYKNIVGSRVRALRLNADLSQEVLSERCGIFRTYLSRIESGSANPTLVVLVALAHSLNVEPHVLLSMDELIL